MHRTSPARGRTARRRTAVAGTLALPVLVGSLLAGTAGAASAASPGRATPPPATTSAGTPVDLDVLFVGAHPDDEAFTLSAFGQWGEAHDARTGVVTITRGEGGGNAVGPEEGPALGLIREAEERRAVARAGITDVFNLDQVDFYYTVSAPLTEEVWGHDDTLERTVRIIRETRPEVLVTMDPAPSPGNHGNHQYAARMAIEAYYAAADPSVFPEQITQEHLQPWAPARVLLNTVRGTTAPGPTCASTVEPQDPAQVVYGVWSGAQAPDGTTWAQVAREAQREYASQGWAGFPDVSSDPAQLPCNYFTQVDARVPSPEPGTDAATSPSAPLQGAVVPGPGGLPLGTTLRVDAEDFRVVQGGSTTVTVQVGAGEHALGASRVALEAPQGWTVTGSGDLGDVAAGTTAGATFTVTPPADAEPGSRVRLGAHLTTQAGTGWAPEEVAVTAPLRGGQEPLPQVAQFQDWAVATGVPQLEGFVTPVLSVPSGGTREVGVVVTNEGDVARSGTVAMDLPAGFSAADPSLPVPVLAPGASTTVPFTVTNTDASLPTSNEGGTEGAAAGDYAYALTTTTAPLEGSAAATSTTTPALELVPATTVPQAAAPTVDGVEAPGEYPGPTLDLSRRWEGDECTSTADCSATAELAWHDDALSVLVHVTDDVRGTALAAADCKRHWRTDSVEIALDPRGDSENTSTTFKAAILPFTAEGGPCYLRDADNHQGPGEETAPGMQVASTVTDDGYTVETTIPLSLLPAAVDPDDLGLDLFVYDSDTQDLTGQTRIGWSTWQGVQGDPYRWGVATLAGYTPPADRPTTPSEPVIPTAALSSLDSPQSVAQAVRNDVPLAGGPAAPRWDRAWTDGAQQRRDAVVVHLRATGTGTAHLAVWDEETSSIVATRTVDVRRSGATRIWVPLPSGTGRPVDARGDTVLVAFEAERGGTFSSRATVR